MILRQKARNQFLFLVRKLKHDCSCCAKKLALNFWWLSTNKITSTHFHHKIILFLSCHVSRVLVVATKLEQVTIRVGNEQLLVITGALIATNVTQIAKSCHYRWYLFLPHLIIQSSIHLICPPFVNIHPGLNISLHGITRALIERTVTKRAMSCHYRWYLLLLYWIIQSSIHLICPWFVNSNPYLHITLLVITGDLAARTLTQTAMIFYHKW